jgi:hypothetical protein
MPKKKRKFKIKKKNKFKAFVEISVGRKYITIRIQKGNIKELK